MAPGPCSTPNIIAAKLNLAPFRAPAELAWGTRGQFSRKHALPAPARLVRKPDPRKVKNFVDQNALELTAATEKLGIEQNPPPRNVGGGQVRSQRSSDLDADGTAR